MAWRCDGAGVTGDVDPAGNLEGQLTPSVQCIGPMFEDRTPLYFGELVERERGGFVPPKL